MRLPLAALAAAALLAAPPARAASAPGARTAAPAAGAPRAPASAGARAKKPAAKAAKPAHPDVGAAGTTDCATCHADATPDVQLAWRQGKHGLSLVKCFVCHGSTGDDFARRPPADRCTGCHADEVASLAQGGKTTQGKDCFACHEPHALSPHAPRPEQTLAARLGADEELRREGKAGPLNGPAAPPPPYTPPAPPAPAAAAPAAPGAKAAAPGAKAPGAQPAPPASDPAKDGAQPHPTTDKPQGTTP